MINYFEVLESCRGTRQSDTDNPCLGPGWWYEDTSDNGLYGPFETKQDAIRDAERDNPC